MGLGGAQGGGLRGKLYRSFSHHHVPLPEWRNSSVPPSSKSQLHAEWGAAGSAAGGGGHPDRFTIGLLGSSRVSWGSPERPEPREYQPPAKRKVKENSTRGEDKQPWLATGGRAGRQWLLKDYPRCRGSPPPRLGRLGRFPPLRSPGATNRRWLGSGGSRPGPVRPWAPAERWLGAHPPLSRAGHGAGSFPNEAWRPERRARPSRPKEREKCVGSRWAATPSRPVPWLVAPAVRNKALKS